MRTIFWIIVILSVVFIISVGTKLAPWFHGDYSYFWSYNPPVLQKFLPFLILIVAYFSFLIFFERHLYLLSGPYGRILLNLNLMGFFFVSVVLQVLALYLINPNPLAEIFQRTVSPGSGGYFNAALTVDNSQELLKDFTQFMPTWEAHPQRHPPGLPFLFVSWRAILEKFPQTAAALASLVRFDQCHNSDLMYLNNPQLASAWIGMILPILGAALLTMPVYWLGKTIYNIEVGWQAAAWIPIVPTLIFFVASPNQLYPLLTFLALSALWFALKKQNYIWAFVAGVLMSIATFLSFTNLIYFGPIAVLFLIDFFNYYLAQTRNTGKNPVFHLLIFGSGVSILWILYWFYTGITPFEIWNIANIYHTSIALPYSPWIWLNLQDFFNFGGWVLAGLALANFGKTLLKLNRLRYISIGDDLPLAYGTSVLVLAFSGMSQGEVSRVWSPYLPLMVLVAASILTKIPGPDIKYGLVTGILVINLIVVVGFLNVGHPNMTSGPTFSPVAPRDDVTATQVNFGDQAYLTGYAITQTRNDNDQIVLNVFLNWRAIRQFDKAYHIFIHFLAEDGTRVAQSDTMPAMLGYPTTCWRPNQQIGDPHQLIFQDVPSGIYDMQVGLFLLNTGERLFVYEDGVPIKDFFQVDDVAIFE